MHPIVDALELLTAQHEAISAGLASMRTVQRHGLAQPLGALADQIATHLAVEERFLASLGLAVDAAAHDELRGAVAELLVMDLSSPAVDEHVARFADQWTAHTAAQDHTMFVTLAELVSPAVLEDIGSELGTWAEQTRCIAA